MHVRSQIDNLYNLQHVTKLIWLSSGRVVYKTDLKY